MYTYLYFVFCFVKLVRSDAPMNIFFTQKHQQFPTTIPPLTLPLPPLLPFSEPPYRVSGVVAVTATRPGASSRMDELNYYLTEMCIRSPHIPRIVPPSYFSLSIQLRFGFFF